MRLVAIASLLAAFGTPVSAAVTESQAVDIVFRAMRQVGPGFPQHCLSLIVEGRSRRAFDIAVREKHGGPCPGDPVVSPIIERFRMVRSPAQLLRFDVINDSYRPCRLTRALQPKCPRLPGN